MHSHERYVIREVVSQTLTRRQYLKLVNQEMVVEHSFQTVWALQTA